MSKKWFYVSSLDPYLSTQLHHEVTRYDKVAQNDKGLDAFRLSVQCWR